MYISEQILRIFKFYLPAVTLPHCCTLQHAATRCNTLQHTPHCNFPTYPDPATLQHTAPHSHCNTLTPLNTATHCTTSACPDPAILQHTATHCNTLQHTATHSHCNTLHHICLPRPGHTAATHCKTLQHTATHCTAPACSDPVTLQHTAPHSN